MIVRRLLEAHVMIILREKYSDTFLEMIRVLANALILY